MSNRDRVFYAGLVPICAVAFGIGVSTFRPTPISNSAQIVITVEAPDVQVHIDQPTPTATAQPTVTRTPYPHVTPLPTWAGQQEEGLFLIPAISPTPFPPLVHQLCVRATPQRASDMSCLGVPFALPEGWFP